MWNSAKLCSRPQLLPKRNVENCRGTIFVLHILQPGIRLVLYAQGQGSGYTCGEIPDSSHQFVDTTFCLVYGRHLFWVYPVEQIAFRILTLYQPVNKDKQSQPDHVHKVPIPGDPFKAKMILRREVASHHTEENHHQHDGSERHVKTVKAGQHEK